MCPLKAIVPEVRSSDKKFNGRTSKTQKNKDEEVAATEKAKNEMLDGT
jgi:hypothetical protein